MRRMILAMSLAALCAGCDKDDGSAEFERGNVAYAAHDLRAAATYFSAAAEKAPTNFVAYVRLAAVNMELGEIASAKAAVEAALTVAPHSAEAKLMEGQIAYYGKDYTLAKRDFDELAEAGQLPAQLRSQAFASRAVMEIAANLFDRARLSLWRAVRLDRRNAAAWYHLGHLSRDTYRFEDAALEQFGMSGRLTTDPVRAKAIARDTIPALREAVRARMAAKPGAAKRDPGAAAKLVSEAEAMVKKDPKKAAAKFAEAYAKDPLSYAAAWNHAKLAIASAKTDRR